MEEKKKISIETYFEFNGIQVNVDDLVGRTKEAYLASGNKLEDVDSVKVYVNANERRAYYVINGEADGKFVEFWREVLDMTGSCESLNLRGMRLCSFFFYES